MKTISYLLVFSFFFYSSTAQLRVHFLTGMANYKGDLQQKEITLKNAGQVYTIGGTYNITRHLLLRTELSVTKLQADDKNNTSADLLSRNLNFKTNLLEGVVMGEYDLFDPELYRMTPYFFAGVGRFNFNPYTSDSLGKKLHLQPLKTEGQGMEQYPGRKAYDLSQFNIPFGAGIKYAVSDFIQIGGEFGSRKLFTDYLDDVSTNYVDQTSLLETYGPGSVAYAFRGDELKANPGSYPEEGIIRGNPRLMDNYYFAQVRLSIRLPWFESGTIQKRDNRRRFDCPRF